MSQSMIQLPDDEHELDFEYFSPTPRQTLRIALNLKFLIDQVIPIEYPLDLITVPKSRILNQQVLQAVYDAAGGSGDGKHGTSSHKYRSVLVFALLKVCGWYWTLRNNEMSDFELYAARACAAQQLAKIVIEAEEDERYLFISMLCHRFSININSEDTEPESALELAVDMHSTIVIGSSGYQRCMDWLWNGHIIQSTRNPQSYVMYNASGDTRFTAHFNPDRIRTPMYQNFLEIFLSVIYLILFTVIINIDSENRTLNAFEILFYIFTASYIVDDAIKLYHIGPSFFSFSILFNELMYIIVALSFGLRVFALWVTKNESSIIYDRISYRVLSLAAPLMWTRLLLFLDAQPFIGVMIVVMKHMMRESAIFFFLIFFILVGFSQGFLGLDQLDGKRDATSLIFSVLFRTVLSGPDFDAFGKFSLPYTTIMYYAFTFLTVTILLNLLIALYSSAYSNVVDNANDEYLALVAQKTLKYIRAPDANVYVPPLNLFEIVFIDMPFQWNLSKESFRNVNRSVMTVIYFPFLIYIAIKETRDAKRISYNRSKHLPDDANRIDTPWSLTDGFDDDGDISEQDARVSQELRVQRALELEDTDFQPNIKEWVHKVKTLSQPVEQGFVKGIGWETFELYQKVDELTILVKKLLKETEELKQKDD